MQVIETERVTLVAVVHTHVNPPLHLHPELISLYLTVPDVFIYMYVYPLQVYWLACS